MNIRKMRKEIIQRMYEVMDDAQEERTAAVYNKATDIFDKELPLEKAEEYGGYVLDMEKASFFAGAEMVLGFISGKEERHES